MDASTVTTFATECGDADTQYFGEVLQLGDVWEGSYKDDKVHGQAKMTAANGDTYDGDWEGGEPHGFGSMRYASGDGYSGDWERGRPTGERGSA